MSNAARELSRSRRALVDRAFAWGCAAVGFVAVAALAVLLGAILWRGLEHLDWHFLTSPPHFRVEETGFLPAMLGSAWLCGVVLVVGMPVGVGAAIFLTEFAPRGPVTGFIRVNIANLAGVPSVVYGLIGLATFVGFWNVFGGDDPVHRLLPEWFPLHVHIPFGRTVLAGGLTLTLLVLPIVIIAAQEALRAVPNSQREAALALGASRWQMVRRAVLPMALPGILTGSILAMSRAIGETAPILVAGAATTVFVNPDGLMSQYSAMPLQIYSWVSDTNPEFRDVAASGIVILLGVLLLFNATAIAIRAATQRATS